MTCNCTVVLVFAAFYIEANLTHIIDEMNDIEKMRDFFHPTQFPGLKNKLSWFYNKFVEEGKATSKRELYADGFRKNLLERFPGFEEIHRFRNDVAHGVIDKSLANLDDTKRLRGQAIDIVRDLFDIAAIAGHEIQRVVTYSMAISSGPDTEEP